MISEEYMADFSSLLKGAVSALGSKDSGSSEGGLDLSQLSTLMQKLTGSKGILEAAMGSTGTDVVSAAGDVQKAIDNGEDEGAIKTFVTVLKSILATAKDNPLCAKVLGAIEKMGV